MDRPIPDSDAVALVKAVPMRDEERDALLIDMHTRVKVIESRFTTLDDHEDRIRDVEKRVWQVPGVSLILALLAAFGLPHS